MTRVTIMLLVIVVSTSASAVAEREMTAEELRQVDAELEKVKREKPDDYRNVVIGAQIVLSAFGFVK